MEQFPISTQMRGSIGRLES